VEAFRAIRTSLLFSFPDDRARSIVVTSVGPGEGKTVIASNLALALAQAGQRVLLVDADLRRPRMHRVFAQEQEPGFSDLMIGRAKLSEVIRKSSVNGLWVLPAGRVPPNPAELLLSPRFKQFINKMPEAFDWVITDSPPVMAVTDASIVGHVVSGVLFVVGTEMTSRHAAQVAVEQLDAAKASFVGAVLNRVDLDRNAFYFSNYYRREYGKYYTPSRTA
jgi:capsular exopolysaccharide synthesis family protein